MAPSPGPAQTPHPLAGLGPQATSSHKRWGLEMAEGTGNGLGQRRQEASIPGWLGSGPAATAEAVA